MYKTILVPLDGSGRAEAILPHVERLALLMRSRVVLMRVIEPGQVIIDPHESLLQVQLDDYRRREEEAAAYLRAIQGELREKGLVCDTRLVHGPVVESILRVAESEEADLVAMASHGRSGLGRVFYGSVAAGVLHQIDRPLLLVRAMG